MADYPKRQVHSNCDPGMVYQSQVTAVVMLGVVELIKSGSITEFTCENLDGADFDDIGLRFNTGSDSTNFTRLFIQAKHTQDKKKVVGWRMLKSTSKTAQFGLSKYYNAFCKIIEKDQQMSSEEISQLILVLCTNISLRKDVEKSMDDKPSIDEVLQNIFNWLSAKLYKFKTTTVMSNFPMVGTEKTRSDFFDKLLFACKTIDTQKLTCQIEDLLNNMSSELFNFKLRGNPSETRVTDWLKLVRDWISEKEATIITGNDIKLIIIYLTLISFSRSHESRFLEQGVETAWDNHELYKKLMLYFEGSTIQTIISHEDPFIVLEILTYFKRKQDKPSKHLFLKSSDFQNFSNQALKLFHEIDQPFLLVIDFTGKEKVNQNITSSNDFEQNSHAKVMIIIKKKKDPLLNE